MNIGIIDIETTGFLKDNGKIVEIGIVSLDTETGTISERAEFICNEGGSENDYIGSWIFENSNLTVDEVIAAPSLDSLGVLIQAILFEFDALTAFNKRFDFDFLRDRGFKIKNEWPCPMLVATDLIKIPKTGKGSFYGGYKWPNVEEAWRFFFPEIKYKELHRGIDDAFHEAQIIYELHKRGLMENKNSKGKQMEALEQAALNLHNAKVAENKAKKVRIECEEVLASMIECPAKGSKTVEAGDHMKVTVTRGVTYKANIAKVKAVNPELIKTTTKEELNARAYEDLWESDKAAFNEVAVFVETVPKKTSVSTKAI